MSSYFSALWDWLVEAYHSMAELVIVNMLWFGLTILVVTAPPAAAGLYYATNQMAHEKAIGWRTFFEGFREHFWMSWRWALANLLVASLIVVNYLFYQGFESAWSTWVQGLFVGLFILWVLLNLYTFPLLLEQEDRRLIIALRNSLVIYIRRPLYAFGTAVLIGILIYGSSRFLFVLWPVITAGLGAYLSSRVTVRVVAELTGAGSAQEQDAGESP